MPPLLLDRYLVLNASQARDLATGDVVAIDGLERRSPPRSASADALAEVLDHGRDGEPRVLIADITEPGWKEAADRVAAAAVDRGYLPIAVDLYGRVLPVIEGDVSERTLLLLASDGDAGRAARAFVDASTRTPRPHVLLTLRHAAGAKRNSSHHVREARAVYGSIARRQPPPPVSVDVLQQVQRATRADEFVAAGRHAAAERLLRDVAGSLARRRAWPQAATVTIALGRLLLERGRSIDAARVFGEAATTAGAAGEELLDAEARLWLAASRTDAGQLTAAEAICRALLQVANLSAAARAWATALLARVLLWQERVHDALALSPLDATPDGMDAICAAFVDATAVRLLLATGRVFDAGVRAHRSLDAGAVLSPLARTIALTSLLRVRIATGDMTGAESTLHAIAAGARDTRTPCRLLRARLIWLAGLRLANRLQEARRECRRLVRMARVAPPLLREAITRAVRDADAYAPAIATRPSIGCGEEAVSAAALVRAAHEEEDECAAVSRMLDTAGRRLRTTRIDIWSADAGPASIIQSSGTGLASTIGGRVLDAGIVVGPEVSDAATQIGLPVRIGTRLLAALVARWPLDRQPPPDARELLALVAAIVAPRLDTLLHRARAEAEAATLIPELIGVSRGIGDVRHAVARAAAAPFSVLVEGESGVGKELIARAVHYLSPRRERRFCDVNCAALPDELLESELFGHAKGAFTGAVADRMGLFEDAHGGTLFLDEVAELSPRAQAKLLRVLQQQEIRRVGETFARAVDVRLVAAANRDMRAEAAAGRFRQDLLYRVDVVRITVPALRERPEDIPVLAHHFWRTAADRVGTIATLGPGLVSALAAYHWPGNVRELQNVIAALAVSAPRRGRVHVDLLPAAITGAMPLRATRLADARDHFERRFVEAALARTGGNRARAARALGLSRQGLLKLMDRLQIASVNREP